MSKTKIEWADTTWNPVTGCTPISPGCANCYARRMAARLAGRYGYPVDEPFRVTLHPDKLEEPLTWKAPRMVFVCSMSDLFHPDVPFEFIERVFGVMLQASQHTFLVLTKRPRTAKMFLDQMLRSDTFKHWPFQNVWIGVSVENQAAADERIPSLLQIPAVRRFVSCEPLLGDIDLASPYTQELFERCAQEDMAKGLLAPREGQFDRNIGLTSTTWDEILPGIHWIIAGYETGPGARTAPVAIVKRLRDQAVAAGIRFFFKGWGEWIPQSQITKEQWPIFNPSEKCFCAGVGIEPHGKVGRRWSGRLLDGRTWDEMPEVSRP